MASFQETIELLGAKAAAAEPFGKIIKVVLDGESAVLNGTTSPPSIQYDEIEVDLVLTATTEDFSQVLHKKANAQMSLMSGKLKIKGDMMSALPLVKLL